MQYTFGKIDVVFQDLTVGDWKVELLLIVKFLVRGRKGGKESESLEVVTTIIKINSDYFTRTVGQH